MAIESPYFSANLMKGRRALPTAEALTGQKTTPAADLTAISKTFTIFEASIQQYHEEILTRMDSLHGYQTIGSHRHHRRPISH